MVRTEEVVTEVGESSYIYPYADSGLALPSPFQTSRNTTTTAAISCCLAFPFQGQQSSLLLEEKEHLWPGVDYEGPEKAARWGVLWESACPVTWHTTKISRFFLAVP